MALWTYDVTTERVVTPLPSSRMPSSRVPDVEPDLVTYSMQVCSGRQRSAGAYPRQRVAYTAHLGDMMHTQLQRHNASCSAHEPILISAMEQSNTC